MVSGTIVVIYRHFQNLLSPFVTLLCHYRCFVHAFTTIFFLGKYLYIAEWRTTRQKNFLCPYCVSICNPVISCRLLTVMLQLLWIITEIAVFFLLFLRNNPLFQSISVWKLWNIRASEEVKKQVVDSRNMEIIEIIEIIENIENIEKKLQKHIVKKLLEAWKHYG